MPRVGTSYPLEGQQGGEEHQRSPDGLGVHLAGPEPRIGEQVPAGQGRGDRAASAAEQGPGSGGAHHRGRHETESENP